MPKTNLKWSFSNRKVTKLDAVSFGIPAFKSETGFKTCPKAGACAAVCYARQGTYTWKTVQNAREFNLKRIRADIGRFIVDASEDLKKIKQSIIRVHDSGDFFSQEYLDAWMGLALLHPNKTFYAYTKSLHLDFKGLPDNFKIIQSEGGTMDKKINKRKSHSRIFSSQKAMDKAGYINGDSDDSLAINQERKIGFIYHGVRKLTESQEKAFS